MKINQPRIQILAALAALGVAVCANVALAADDIIVGPTGSQTGTSGTSPTYEWQNMWGPAFVSITWDTANPPPSGDTLGSIYLQGDWTGDSGGMDDYNIGAPGNWWGGATFDASQYASIELDFKYDTTSTMTPTNNAHVQIGFDQGYNNYSLINYPNNGSSTIFDGSWHHLSIPIPSDISAPTCHSVSFYQWNPAGTSGTMNFWVANVVIKARVVPIAPPTVKSPLTPAITGLNCTATDPSGQYDRYNVLTAPPSGFTFLGQPSVTYAWTNKTWPSIGTANSWQQQFFIVSGTPGQYDSAVDWNMANVLWFTVQQATNGTGYINFRCKTNNPGGNGMLFNTTPPTYSGGASDWPVEPLVFFPATTPLGAWSVTIAGTTVTLTTPDGTSTNYMLDPAWAALFAEPVTLCLGDQPNNPNGYGQNEVISGFGVTGNVTPFSDNFTTDTQLNTNYWRVLASDPNGVNQVPPGSYAWMTWNLPDTGFSPQTAATVTGDAFSWYDIIGTTIINNGNRSVLVPQSALQGVNQNYFRLIKRSFTQLQVLLPGETSAPNTLSGKTGTPTAQNTTDPVNVTVNACDTTWHVVSGVTDTIQLATPTDGVSIIPGAGPLANGTATFQLYFGTTGSQTVTATDTTTNTIPVATSASVTVN